MLGLVRRALGAAAGRGLADAAEGEAGGVTAVAGGCGAGEVGSVARGQRGEAGGVSGGATFERGPAGAYRYRLWRRWGDGAAVLFVLLNPSTADGDHDDATLRRCVAFARGWGYGALEVGNLFALCATDPRRLRVVADPVGRANDRHLRRAAHNVDLVVAGWGVAGGHLGRDAVVARLLARAASGRLFCLGRTAAGHPRHPLYAAGGLVPVPFTPLRGSDP